MHLTSTSVSVLRPPLEHDRHDVSLCQRRWYLWCRVGSPCRFVSVGDGYCSWILLDLPLGVPLVNRVKSSFILLENTYHGLDKIAKHRRVFQVETIGDCICCRLWSTRYVDKTCYYSIPQFYRSQNHAHIEPIHLGYVVICISNKSSLF
jgi:hypothetical protein